MSLAQSSKMALPSPKAESHVPLMYVFDK